MKRLDIIEERIEFSSSEILQQRGTMVGRWIGFLYGMVFAMLCYIILK